MFLTIVVAILTLVVSLAMPLVAYPLATGLKRGRKALDDMMTWKGKNAKLKEQIEDALTHATTVALALIVFLIIGLVFLWYVDRYTLVANPWLFVVVGNAPLVGFKAIGYYNIGPALYWLFAYGASFIVGWIRAR